jgi:hypothetical protein
VAAAVRTAPPESRAVAVAEARNLATAAFEMRGGSLEEQRVYSIIGCGAVVGVGAFIANFLMQKQVELFGNPVTGGP